jgi:hypothetical protein
VGQEDETRRLSHAKRSQEDLSQPAASATPSPCRFTFRVYQRAAKRRAKLQGRYLEAFDAARDWALMGTGGDSGDLLTAPEVPMQTQETAERSQK